MGRTYSFINGPWYVKACYGTTTTSYKAHMSSSRFHSHEGGTMREVLSIHIGESLLFWSFLPFFNVFCFFQVKLGSKWAMPAGNSIVLNMESCLMVKCLLMIQSAKRMIPSTPFSPKPVLANTYQELFSLI